MRRIASSSFVLIFAILALTMACIWSKDIFADSSDDLLMVIGPIVAGRCRYSLDKTLLHFNESGGNQSVTVTASGAACSWTTVVPDTVKGWITATPSGVGSGLATITTLANTGANARSGTIQVAGESVTVSQAGTATPYFILPDTGQTLCYNDTNVITCPSKGQNYYGQDGNYQGSQPSYTDNGDGTITDNLTGLMWQSIYNDNDYTWDEASSYCSSIRDAGYTDWRVPSRKELLTIVDAAHYFPAVDSVFVGTLKSGYCWTNTTYVGDSSGAWYVEFGVGQSNYRAKETPSYVKCVRGGY